MIVVVLRLRHEAGDTNFLRYEEFSVKQMGTEIIQ
jgi:hypothetical protein